ncbi:MAG TPA: hypothetical protein VKR56_07785 [Candidatus Cybelea sp.]|nr:hypothetical protein [Candidatus Cybelea sp.]
MNGPVSVARNERATPARGVLAAPRGGAQPPPPSDGDVDGQRQIAAQHQAFDFEAAERAEILREHEVLQTMLMAHLKNEDEITKKWIALI